MKIDYNYIVHKQKTPLLGGAWWDTKFFTFLRLKKIPYVL